MLEPNPFRMLDFQPGSFRSYQAAMTGLPSLKSRDFTPLIVRIKRFPSV
jgi:hypothetical protein